VGKRRLPLKVSLAIVVLSAVFFFTRTLWLAGLGRALVFDQPPAKADMAVVLGGDYTGRRILKGAELVREGYVPVVLVSGPPDFYGSHESDFAIQFAIRRGCPAGWFVALPISALSTRDEAVQVLAELHRRNVRSFLLVTSNYHTARAARTYRWAEKAMADPPNFRTVAAPDDYFQPDSWWRTREGRRTLFIEWTKTVAYALGI